VARRLASQPTGESLGEASGRPGAQRAGHQWSPAAIVRSIRPRQWLKNLLVLVAPAAAGRLGHGATFGRSVAALAIFSAVASGLYLLNDVVDIEADRLHPRKRHRPVPSGQVSVAMALSVGSVLVGAGLASAWLLAGWRLFVVMALYLAISVAYSLWVKSLAVVELASVAAGFVLRAIAGGVATNLPLSDWFLAVTSFSALFIVTGKRFAEHRTLGTQRGGHRTVLGEYTPSFLQSTLTLTATAAVTTYCLWAFDHSGTGLGSPHAGHDTIWIQLTVVPFALAVLHVLRVLDAGGGEAPEDLAVHDRWLQGFGAVWVVLFLVGIYA